MHRTTPNGGGTIAKSEDGTRCVVAGKESLRILTMSGPSQVSNADHKSSIGRGGHRIDSTRNLWDGSGLKMDSASTDVAWGYGAFDRKILTSARNGDLIMWDIDKSGQSKFERRTRDHVRSIQKLSYSRIVHYYCITGSADGDVRVWDLRDMSRSLMKIHHPTSVRSLVFSPSLSSPLQAVVGLDNGSIYRWDLKMGQRGQLDRLPVAHSGSILSLDWCNATSTADTSSGSEGTPNIEGGWVVSGGLDHTVKIWDLTATGANSHIPHKPTYTLHPAYPVRRVLWRPDYPCELALVSNAELGYGSNPDLMHNIVGTGTLTSPRMPPSELALRIGNEGKVSDSKNVVGDAVEIWDVRRGWIAKWTVEASFIEGAVTDIAFCDSHSMWAQHASGTFAQLDLRQSVKPISAVPRVSLSWGISGSLAFVSDRQTRCEVPYDDLNPEKRQLIKDRKMKFKTLGDGARVPGLQSMGMYTQSSSDQNSEALSKLAREYVFEGADRQHICIMNSEVSIYHHLVDCVVDSSYKIAIQAGKVQASQVWLLLASLLTDIIPDNYCESLPAPAPATNPPLPHSISAPAALPTISSTPSKFASKRATSSDSLVQLPQTQRSPASRHDVEAEVVTKVPSNSRNLTPVSSASSSPRRPLSALPLATPRQPSVFSHRESNTGFVRRPSVLSRPSVTSNTTSENPSESSRSHSNLRHVGEGALDDSDSSENDDSEDPGKDGYCSNSDEETGLRPLISPYTKPTRVPTHPSPLSHIAGQEEWTDDEGEDHSEGEASPSPGSTDTESSSSNAARNRTRKSSSLRKQSSRVKSRSRSSTVASLAAPLSHRALIKQESQNSIRTVIAGDASARDQEFDAELAIDDTARGVYSNKSVDKQPLTSHKRKISQVFSGDSAPQFKDCGDEERTFPSMCKVQISRQRKELVQEEEAKLRDIGWQALRDALEQYADEGDVQMCTMLSLVAGQELSISKSRLLRFVESYIDILTRLRLDTSAAYLRKFSGVNDVCNMTKLETTVYTACGNCRKPVNLSTSQRNGSSKKGAFSYCNACRKAFKCAICHLPVKALMFQCSICEHGGHQECYRRYYMGRPLVEVKGPTPFGDENMAHLVARDSPSLSLGDTDGSAPSSDVFASATSTLGSAQLMGHMCAAGCGHHCWAAAKNEGSDL
ncbi:hypothetical protein SERLA73DRAFT_93871 [Serpula lacrymans var. lacrymans S7.3]|uniref:Uncharacterized protein n=1 Tax=Serpula lacrymans var. lacrymans (strain S7.3) TaxID=936435 RepID=F8Q5U1_SERL3|nr:hypothetical protein SERLA73DRAFT_93871 [Serpula lacrymans var. lacrymans S7.3]